jgi:hypothetical protein
MLRLQFMQGFVWVVDAVPILCRVMLCTPQFGREFRPLLPPFSTRSYYKCTIQIHIRFHVLRSVRMRVEFQSELECNAAMSEPLRETLYNQNIKE